MKSGAAEGRGTRVLRSAAEYFTHWVIAGTIITLTGFAPEHWIADLFGHLAIPESIRHSWLQGFDIRIGLVAVGIAIIAWDVLRRTHSQKQEVLPNSSQGTQGRVQESAQSSAGAKQPRPIEAATLALPDKPSIAVLPFQNISGDPEQEYFTDGITEDIITELSRFHSLFVIAKNSTFTYKGKTVDIKQIGRELGVRYVLEGSIRRATSRVRVTAQLIDALTGIHVWAEKYDRVLEDIFAVQEEVTRSIVAAIAPQIEDAEVAAARRARPGNLSAYEIAVKARANAFEAYGTGNRELRNQAIREAREALAEDSGSLLALHALAFSQYQNVLYGPAADRETAWQDGMAAATRAIGLDRSDHRAYVWKGMLHLFATGEAQWAEALANLRRANELNQNDSAALLCLAYGETICGDAHLGIEYLTCWLRLSPCDPWIYRAHNNLAIACFFSRDYEKALHWALLANSESLNLPHPYLYCALAYVGLAEIDKAKAALDRGRSIAPEFIQSRLNGLMPFRRPEDRKRFTIFLRIAAGLEDPSAADALR